ncbi:MAG: diaminopimelate epimerase [Synechococcus sp.]
MLQFSKYQGLGNDFVLIEGRDGCLDDAITAPDPQWVRHLCDRRLGIGADGIILALPPQASGELRMRIFNADGSEAEMCGNGIRCLARFLADSDGDAPGRSWTIETLAGPIIPVLQEDGQIKVDMGAPMLQPEAVPTTLAVGDHGLPQGAIAVAGTLLYVAAVGMGNPHVVVPVDDLATIPFDAWGAALEVEPSFPAKTNVHFLKVKARDALEIRVWERGAGPTLACGTGACATLVAAHLLGLADNAAQVMLPGGPLHIHWPNRDGSVFMTGPAEAVFDGVVVPDLVPASVGGSRSATTGPAAQAQARATDSSPAAQASATFDCSRDCRDSCVQPDNCLRAEAQQQVKSLLDSMSLDAMINLATDSLEERTRSRLQQNLGG